LVSCNRFWSLTLDVEEEEEEDDDDDDKGGDYLSL
jgi:hypothetical protein